jgi:DnaK suppressor protein
LFLFDGPTTVLPSASIRAETVSAAVARRLPAPFTKPTVSKRGALVGQGESRRGNVMATTTHRIRGVNRTRHGKLEQLLIRQSAILRDRRLILRGDLPTPASAVTDLEENALDAEEQGVGFRVLELTSRTVQGIETALQRLEAGELGTCSDCRCRISDARLRALPFAALCLTCQERHDLTTGWGERVATSRNGLIGQ